MFVQLLQQLRPLRGLPVWVRYLLTSLIVFACFGLRYALSGTTDAENLPLYLMFVPAVIVSAFAFDRGSGFFAVGLSGVLGLYFFIEPHQTFEIHNLGEVARLIVFIAVGLLTAAIIEALRKTVDQLAERTEELAAERERLARDYVLLGDADRQKDLLLTDINHRVKNHLQSISGIIGMSARRAESLEDAREALEAAARRLSVLGRVYDRLHLARDQAVVDARDFLTSLCSDLKSTIGELRPITMRVDVEPIDLDASRAVSTGLIINELVTNALKYGFPDGREGEIAVTFRRQEHELCLTVQDDGIGIGQVAGESTGRRLVRALARQLGGHAEWTTDGGTIVTLTFPHVGDEQQVF